MRAMLDTHVWLWYLLGDNRLSKQQKHMIADEKVELWLSPISVWEAHLLMEEKRLPVKDTPGNWIKKALQVFPIREAALTFAIAKRSRAVVLQHRDPADRFIAATALEMGMPLLTADERLCSCAELKCIP